MANWQTPKTNWDTHPKAIEAADLNRIERNIEVVREQNDMPLNLEVVTSFPAHVAGRAIYHVGEQHAYVSDGDKWMPFAAEDRGGMIFTPSTVNQTIPIGYHNGQGYVKGDANLVADNIRHGVSIFGVGGNFKIPALNDSGWEEYVSEEVYSGSNYRQGLAFRVDTNYIHRYELDDEGSGSLGNKLKPFDWGSYYYKAAYFPIQGYTCGNLEATSPSAGFPTARYEISRPEKFLMLSFLDFNFSENVYVMSYRPFIAVGATFKIYRLLKT